MVTNKTIAERIARLSVKYLSTKGIAFKCDYKFMPIKKILRDSWYVKKICEFGHTDCIFIDLPDAGSFFAVLEDGRLMSGMNLMVQDAIWSIYVEYVDSEFPYDLFDTLRMDSYSDNCGDNGLIVIDLCVFRDWFDSCVLRSETNVFS